MIAVSAELQYEVTERTSFVFSVHPAESEHQHVMSEQVYIWSDREPPRHQQREAVDGDGNRLLVVSSDPGPLTIGYTAVVALEPYVPVVEPPAIATTLSSSIRRVAKVRALLASPPSS